MNEQDDMIRAFSTSKTLVGRVRQVGTDSRPDIDESEFMRLPRHERRRIEAEQRKARTQ